MVGWFEIPVIDMARATRFYEAVFDCTMTHSPMGELDMTFFPWAEGGIGAAGALVYHPDYYKPSEEQGALVYFTAFSGDLDNELARVAPAGGRVIMPKRLIAEEVGYMAVFIDTEGNRIALHSRA